jgi:hypothetical protein
MLQALQWSIEAVVASDIAVLCIYVSARRLCPYRVHWDLELRRQALRMGVDMLMSARKAHFPLQADLCSGLQIRA